MLDRCFEMIALREIFKLENAVKNGKFEFKTSTDVS